MVDSAEGISKVVSELLKSHRYVVACGFESTVRLAKSSPKMWSPIFVGNKKNILTSLDGFIKNLQEFKEIMN